MKRLIAITVLFQLLVAKPVIAQFNLAWQGKKCAVVITYDDAINEHLDNAVPVLDSLGLKATFYITGFSSSMRSRLNDWKKIATKGHELGNHTMYHPCNGGKGREWVPPDYDLTNYTVQRIADEVKTTNLLLQSMDGKTQRTFAFPCADTKIGDSAYGNAFKNDFVAMRNVRSQMHTIDKVDLNDVDCYMVNNHSFKEMKIWVEQAVETNSLLVILFHGVGGGNGLDVSIPAHRELLIYLKQNEKDIWIAPMVEVAAYVKKWQSK